MNETKKLWAKTDPFLSLETHMLETGVCARTVLEQRSFSGCRRQLSVMLSLDEMAVIDLLGYWASLHDMGKAHPAFQKKDLSEIAALLTEQPDWFSTLDQPTVFRHEKYTERALNRIWGKAKSMPPTIAETVSCALGLHHQGKSNACGRIYRHADAWETMQDELEAEMRNFFSPPLARLEDCINHNALGMCVMGIVILSDWVASSEHFAAEDGDLQVRALHTLQTFGLSASAPFPEVLSFETLFPRIGTKGMRPLQHACAAIACQAPMLTILEAPMGEGKTEAALYLATQLIEAYGLHGLYVALPTAATSNQMHARVGAMLEGLGMGEARLMHGMAWLLDAVCDVSQVRSEDAEAIRAWLAPLRRAMLSENAVGTVDQAMLAAMQAKYGVLRLIGLMNKVLIIDEVHAYDAYMSQILEGLLSWCHVLGIPVLLLSATLQSAKKRDFLNAYDAHVPPCLQDAYPLVTYVQADGTVVEMDVPNPHMHRSYRFAVVPHLGDAPFIAEMAASLVAQGGCLCVMLNTIAEAQEVYCALKELAFEEVLLFHARFEADRRNALEREVVALFGKDGHRPQRAILVCTQVVEQSLDLDFDAMITAIAPMDLLMQRAGRVQRHDGRLRPVAFQGSVIYVLTPKEQGKYGGTGAVYAECFLERTRAFLGDGQCVAVPEDMRGCIESVYGKPVAKEEMLDERWLKFFFQTDDEKAQAQAAMLPDPQPCSFFPTEQMDVFMQTDDENSRFRAVHTRIGTPSTRVALVKRHEIEYLLKNPFDLLFSLEIYGRTFAINVELYDNILHQSKDVVEGKGHLRGCLLLLAPEGVFSCKSCRIVHDPILGGKIEKGA